MKRPAPPIPPAKPTPTGTAGVRKPPPMRVVTKGWFTMKEEEVDIEDLRKEDLREDELRENRLLFWLIFVAFALIVVVLVPVLAARMMGAK